MEGLHYGTSRAPGKEATSWVMIRVSLFRIFIPEVHTCLLSLAKLQADSATKNSDRSLHSLCCALVSLNHVCMIGSERTPQTSAELLQPCVHCLQFSMTLTVEEEHSPASRTLVGVSSVPIVRHPKALSISRNPEP